MRFLFPEAVTQFLATRNLHCQFVRSFYYIQNITHKFTTTFYYVVQNSRRASAIVSIAKRNAHGNSSAGTFLIWTLVRKRFYFTSIFRICTPPAVLMRTKKTPLPRVSLASRILPRAGRSICITLWPRLLNTLTLRTLPKPLFIAQPPHIDFGVPLHHRRCLDPNPELHRPGPAGG